VLFSILAAAGLGASRLFRKARILAIFDDLDTVLALIPLQVVIVGFRWELAVTEVLMVVLLWAGWRYLHQVTWPTSYRWVAGLLRGDRGRSEVIYPPARLRAPTWHSHRGAAAGLRVGFVLAVPAGHDPHADDAREGHQDGPPELGEQRAATIVAACFMFLVGMSMPVFVGGTERPATAPCRGSRRRWAGA